MKVIVVLLLVFVAESVQSNVKLSLHYESLCHGCKAFVTKQLFPTYQILKQYLILDLVPYGKANQTRNADGKWQFECQHGKNECYGNKMQACLLKLNVTFDQKVEFINCIERKNMPDDQSGEQCSNETNIPWNILHTCTNNNVGSDYLAELGDITHSLNPALVYVPDIRFNDIFDRDMEDKAIDNLKSVVCELVGQPKECQTISL